MSRSKKVPLLPAGILLAITFAAYFNALSAEFVFDDIQNVIENVWIKDIKYLPRIFASHLAGFDASYATSYYRPLIHVIYMLSYAVFGLSPLGFHLVNVLFHVGASVLVFFIAARLLSASHDSPSPRFLSPALLAALLFAVHPVHTEAVTWIAGVMDVSFTLFFLLSLHLYMRSEEGTDYNYYLSIISFFLATLCKEPALTLPFILIAYDFLFKRTDFRLPRLAVRYLPYLFVMGLYLLLRINALGGFAPSKTPIDLSPYQYVINIVALLSQYLAKLAFPFNLNIMHSFHPITSIFQPRGMFSLLFALAILYLSFRARKDRVISFSLILMVLPLLPTFYFKGISGGEGVFAERYLYLPSAGFVILLSLVLARIMLSASVPKIAYSFVFVALLVSYSAGTIVRNTAWKNNYTLWTDTVHKNPGSAAAHRFLGFALYVDGRLDEAIVQYKIALDLKPNDEDAHLNLGVAYNLEDLPDKAIAEYQAALMLNPDNPTAHNNLGGSYNTIGLTDEAGAHFEAALKLNPDYAEAHNGLGIVCIKKERIDEAIDHFRAAVRLAPDNQNFNDNLIKAYEFKTNIQGIKRRS